jgi:2-polyprenyl-3-methyl-5-hydroxy-6-metoxy-1,4-benzoquinol methylase
MFYHKLTKDKRHWYDGRIYDLVIASKQDGSFGKISSLVNPGSDVLDIGCATGKLVFTLAGKCRMVMGIDLSVTNINRALLHMTRNNVPNISFRHIDISELSNEKLHFDYGIFSYVLHEADESARLDMIKNAMMICDRLIIADFTSRTNGVAKMIRETAEFLAGREHFINHLSFLEKGGINYLAKMAGLQIVHEEIFKNHLHICVLIR